MSKQPEASSPAPSGKLPVKVLGIVAGIMVLEAVGVYALVSVLSHKPADAAAHEIKVGEVEAANALVEVPLVEEPFQNLSTNKVWIWDVAVFLKVRKKDETHVTDTLKKHAAEIREGVSLIVRRATHNHLKEPGLETLNRQIVAFVNEIVGEQADGNPYVERVLIPRCRGFPAD